MIRLFSGQTIAEAAREISRYFAASSVFFGHGTDNPDDEAVQLLMARTGLSYEALEASHDRPISAEEVAKLALDCKRRVEVRIPLPYITHQAHLGGLTFYVDERVIIPRSPIAALINQQFFPWLTSEPKAMLDMCTGSACLAILMAKNFPQSQIDAVDISSDALTVAEQNRITHHAANVHLIQSDLFEQVPKKTYDVIVCNPPYVNDHDFNTRPDEFKHEPDLALYAEDHGLAIVESLLKAAPTYLSDQGILIVEVGNSADALIQRYPTMPFVWLEFEGGGEGVFLLTKDILSA